MWRAARLGGCSQRPRRSRWAGRRCRPRRRGSDRRVQRRIDRNGRRGGLWTRRGLWARRGHGPHRWRDLHRRGADPAAGRRRVRRGIRRRIRRRVDRQRRGRRHHRRRQRGFRARPEGGRRAQGCHLGWRVARNLLEIGGAWHRVSGTFRPRFLGPTLGECARHSACAWPAAVRESHLRSSDRCVRSGGRHPTDSGPGRAVRAR